VLSCTEQRRSQLFAFNLDDHVKRAMHELQQTEWLQQVAAQRGALGRNATRCEAALCNAAQRGATRRKVM
jgi:hypothetical protein